MDLDGKWYTFKGDKSVKIVLLPCVMGSALKEKNLLPWEQILSFKSRPLSEGGWCKGRQTWSHKSSLLSKMATSLHVVYRLGNGDL